PAGLLAAAQTIAAGLPRGTGAVHRPATAVREGATAAGVVGGAGLAHARRLAGALARALLPLRAVADYRRAAAVLQCAAGAGVGGAGLANRCGRLALAALADLARLAAGRTAGREAIGGASADAVTASLACATASRTPAAAANRRPGRATTGATRANAGA